MLVSYYKHIGKKLIWKDVSRISAEEQMKNRLPHRVPLTDMIIAELKALGLTHN